jgi:hypothetical protein
VRVVCITESPRSGPFGSRDSGKESSDEFEKRLSEMMKEGDEKLLVINPLGVASRLEGMISLHKRGKFHHSCSYGSQKPDTITC